MKCSLRNKIYWGVSTVKKTPVRSFVKEFESYYGKDNIKTSELQKQRLENIIEHACKTTEYYKDYNSKKLEEFPIINKEILKENAEKFISSKYKRENLIIATTSGSTGAPFSYCLTKEKKYRQNAEVIFFNKWGGYEVGDKHAYVRVTKTKNKVKLFMQNEVLMNPTNITEEWLEEQRNKLLKKRIKTLIGYPSAILALAEYCLKKGDKASNFNITGVITSSETLYDTMRNTIKNVFGCEVISRYSTEEFGVLATECKIYNKHHVNELSYIIEILDINSDNHVKEGEIGRVVVTDLFSHAMPLIRYDTGDLAILGNECDCGLKTIILQSIEGRKIETIYNQNGERVSAFAINGAMRDLKTVYQYQFVQNTPKDNILRLCVQDNFSESEIIISRLKEILGEKSIIKIEYVKEIPKLKSGKRPYIISNYKK